eukprot:TRINITY_DN1086_c0_g1_i1.p2 TRINITY_DN1086_c0_g1~~TRINITY_DN1086_c0_g1_i1.p2  ORF type:complete len:284 (+),score=54.54 TRINITY_DN1086_c0_g1_i1:1296-2147(+)
MKRGAKGYEEMFQKLFVLIKDGDIKSAIHLFEAGDKAQLVKDTDQDKWTALHWAAHVGSLEVTALLIENGAEINAQTVQGFSALYIATRQARMEVLVYLLKRGADPNLQDGHLQTALHRACENSLGELANSLIELGLERGIDLNIQDLMGRTPLHWAAAKNLVETTRLLLEHNATLQKTKGGEDVLHWASRSGADKAILLILQKYPQQVNIFSKNEREETCVDVAATDYIRDILLAHAASLGYTDDAKNKVQNVVQTTTVKRLDQAPKGKKLNIKLKPKDDKK